MKRRTLILFALVALAAAVRLVVAYWVGETPLIGDEWDYYRRAMGVLAGNPRGDGFRAPLFEYLLAGIAHLGVKSPAALRMALAALSSLIVLPMFLAGERLANTRTGVIAATLAALYPPLIAYSHYLWTEALYTASGVATLLLTVDTLTYRKVWRGVLAGLCWAALMLTREVALAALVTVLGWAAWQLKPSRWIPDLAPLALAAALPVVAWSVHMNASNQPGDAYSLIARTSYLNLYLGNGPTAEIKEKYPKLSPRKHYESLARSAAQREALAKPLVWKCIRDAGLAWLPDKITTMVPKFFRPGGFPVRRLLIPETEPRSPWGYRDREGHAFDAAHSRGIASWFVAIVSITLVLGTAGWILLGGTTSGAALYGLVSAFALGHLWPTILAFATTRFRLPAMPLFLLGAAYLLANSTAAWSYASRYRRLALFGMTAAMLWLVYTEHNRAMTAGWQ